MVPPDTTRQSPAKLEWSEPNCSIEEPIDCEPVLRSLTEPVVEPVVPRTILNTPVLLPPMVIMLSAT